MKRSLNNTWFILLFLNISFISLAQTQTKETEKSVKKKIKDKPNIYEINFKPIKASEKNRIIKHSNDFYNEYLKDSIWGGFLVAKNGKILYEKYQGFSNLNKKTKINARTPMHVASIGKVFTSICILRLIEKGAFGLDQKVSELIKDFPYKKVTVRMLLNHRSGLPKYEKFATKYKIWNRKRIMRNKDVIRLLINKKPKLITPTNTQFKYCNTNFVVLAEIAERVTKKPLNEIMKILIYKPLKMTDTFVMDNLSRKHEVTQSYYKSKRIMRWDYLDGTYGDKNIYTTPRDLLKLDLAMYSDRFMSKKLKNQIYRGYSKVPKGESNYGLGLRIIEPIIKSDDTYTYHTGWWRGNKTKYFTKKKDTLAIICFGNKNTGQAYEIKYLAKHFGNFSFIKKTKVKSKKK